jgi:hypothetical protein
MRFDQKQMQKIESFRGGTNYAESRLERIWFWRKKTVVVMRRRGREMQM